MPFLALSWGLIAGSAVFVGAALGWYARLPPHLIAAFMAFGSGVLMSVVAFEILDDAFKTGGFLPTRPRA